MGQTLTSGCTIESLLGYNNSLQNRQGALNGTKIWMRETCESIPQEGVDRILQHVRRVTGPTHFCRLDGSGRTANDETLHEADIDAPVETERKVTETSNVTRKNLFVIVNNGKKRRRLHKSHGGCWMGRDEFQVSDRASHHT